VAERKPPVILVYSASKADSRFFKRAFPGYEVICQPGAIIDPMIPEAKRAEVIAIHVASSMNAAQMKFFPKLKHIACRSTGFDNVDLKAAKKHSIIVTNVPSYGEHTVAEYAFLLALSLMRRLPAVIDAVAQRETTSTDLVGHELAGKTLGVIGAGKIGRRVIQIGRGFNMRVIAFDPYPDQASAIELGYEYEVLNDVLAHADILSLHAPATKDNLHLINATALARMKKSAIIINTARGSLIDTDALVAALASKRIGGAGLDVVEGEQYLNLDDELHLITEKRAVGTQIIDIERLRELPNVILSSHNAFNSAEALQRIRETTAHNIQAVITDSPVNKVA